MNRFDHQWQKLTALARQARDERGAGAPYGFATRVAALAARPPAAGAPFGHFALRGLMVAAVCGVAAAAFNYSTAAAESTESDAATDTIGDLLDFS